MYIYIYRDIYIYICIRIHIHTYMHTHVYANVYIYRCVCIYIYIYIYTHIHIPSGALAIVQCLPVCAPPLTPSGFYSYRLRPFLTARRKESKATLADRLAASRNYKQVGQEHYPDLL